MKTPVRTRLLSALLSLVMLVSLLPVSVFAAEPASGTWEKVTEAQEDWSGQYLIVYEKGSLIMDGSLSALDKEGNKVDVTITDGKIVGDYAKYAFTIAPMTGGWSIQSAAESTFPASPAATRSSPAPLRSSTPSPLLMVM